MKVLVENLSKIDHFYSSKAVFKRKNWCFYIGKCMRKQYNIKFCRKLIDE